MQINVEEISDESRDITLASNATRALRVFFYMFTSEISPEMSQYSWKENADGSHRPERDREGECRRAVGTGRLLSRQREEFGQRCGPSSEDVTRSDVMCK